MRWYRALCLLVVAGGIVSNAAAQATGVPSYNAPYRAFRSSEFGAILSFPQGGGTAFEGAYRMASGKFDLGFRGGIFMPGIAGFTGMGPRFRTSSPVITATTPGAFRATSTSRRVMRA